jgi:hypothetical protein
MEQASFAFALNIYSKFHDATTRVCCGIRIFTQLGLTASLPQSNAERIGRRQICAFTLRQNRLT